MQHSLDLMIADQQDLFAFGGFAHHSESGLGCILKGVGD